MPINSRTQPKFRLTKTTEVKVKRSGMGEYQKGRWVKTLPEDLIIEGNVQPLGFREAMQLPESDRTKDCIEVYTTEYLRTEKEGQDGWGADIIEWQGFSYKVLKCRSFVMGTLDHFHVIAVREPISARGA